MNIYEYIYIYILRVRISVYILITCINGLGQIEHLRLFCHNSFSLHINYCRFIHCIIKSKFVQPYVDNLPSIISIYNLQ